MSISFEDKINFLRNQKIFNELLEEDLSKIARRWTLSTYIVDEVVYTQGSNDKGVYIIYSGEVAAYEELNGKRSLIAKKVPYDDFGIDELLKNASRTSTVIATKESEILTMTASNFVWLLQTFPQVQQNLDALSKVKGFVSKLSFDWLHAGETVFMVTRRHPAELWIELLKPLAALLLSGLFLIITRLIPGLIGLSTIIGGVLAVFSFLWIIWLGFDWQNDYFIITSQRIVWIEQVILSRSSRQEIPLPQIQFVNVDRSYWGRVFNFGDVTIRTYTRTGNLRLTFVRDPMTFQALIDEQLVRSREKEVESKTEALRHSIRQSLGVEKEILADELNQEPVLVEKSPGILKTRVVSHGEITYHKHWMVLVKAIWWQVIGFAGIAGIILFTMFNTSENFFMPSLQTVLIACFIAGVLLSLVLWYHIVDYQNDIYRLTSEMVIDLEKKPFGKEISKTAPLKNIQSIRIARNGIIQVALNYGAVLVNVADETLDFIYVHNPAQVQRDIFYKKRQLEMSEEKNEIDQEHERITDYLSMYREVWQKEDHGSEDEFEENN